ncbi:MAG TPA: hypothetical protein VMK53_10655 [Gemmatimonadales bacterium]|nr:hypothetical protein [Gemmatimonadales bacterium]
MTRRLLLLAGILVAGCQAGDAPLTRTTLPTGQPDHWYFAYSPDGSQLAFTAASDAGVRLWVSNADGTEPRALTEPASFISHPVWAGDGQRIYFSSSASGQYGLHEVSLGPEPVVRRLVPEAAVAIVAEAHPTGGLLFYIIAGGGADLMRLPPGADDPVVVAASPRDEFGGHWSPDGTRVGFVVARDGRELVEVISIDGGDPVLIGPPDGTVRLPTVRWLPDGSAMLFAAAPFGNMDLYVAPADGSAPRQLTRDIRDDWAPAISPDGRHVAFLSLRGGQHDVWVVPLEGGEPLRVTNDPQTEGEPQWTPDGSGVVFSYGSSPAEVHVAEVASGETRTLVAMPRDARGAEFSPDGRTVGFRMAFNGVDQVWTVPAEGGDPTPLTRDGVRKGLFSFSRDGSRIFYLADDGPGQTLFSVPVTGGEPTRLTDDATTKTYFGRISETADGSLLGYSGASTDGGYEYFVVPSTGGSPRAVTNWRTVNAGMLLPDGSAAIVTSYHQGGVEAQLYLVPLDGGAPRQIPTTGGWVFDALPSPDGQHLAYTQVVDGDFTVGLVPISGGEPRRLSPPGTNVGTYNWMPDGQSLVVALGAGQSTRLALIETADGEVRYLTPPGTNAAAGWPSPDGSEVVYSSQQFARQLVRVDVTPLMGQR